jgi:hypothetical protein
MPRRETLRAMPCPLAARTQLMVAPVLLEHNDERRLRAR